MLDLGDIFGPVVGKKPDRKIEKVYFDVLNTLEKNGKARKAIEDLLLFCKDQGAEVGVFSSGPREAFDALVKAGNGPKVREIPIEEKLQVYADAFRKGTVLAVVDDDYLLAVFNDVEIAVNPDDKTFKQYVEKKEYLNLIPSP